MNKATIVSFQLMRGFQLANERLIEKAKRNNDTLVVQRDGKIEYVKARDL